MNNVSAGEITQSTMIEAFEEMIALAKHALN
jgi:hypothetical protein